MPPDSPRHYVLAFSGGLDTSYGLAVLVDRGARVTTVTVNTGGFDAAELRDIATRAQALGAADHVVVDGRARLYEQFVSYILKANYLRNGVYPSCVGVERMLQAEEVTRVALERGADAIAHGSTGAGNDHVRFDAVTKAMAPKLEIFGLIRDEQHTREEERDFLRERGHPVSEITARYSFNYGILGTTIGGEETYGSWEYLPENAWPTTVSIADAPAEPAELTLTFEHGLPVAYELSGGPAIDVSGTGIGVPGYDTLAALNRIGAAHGVGRGIHTGQTIMGIVGRLGFEAPGMLTLIAAHRELERLVLTNAQQTLKASLGTTFGDMLHEGRYYDPLLSDIRAFLDSSQERVTGEVRVRLHKGSIIPLGCRSPWSLLDAGRRLGSTYGHGSSLWTGEEARAFAHIYATAGVLANSTGAEPGS
ncbi:MAG TPA: argininosuccinate synthase domain-containing protein [Solirubrobacteraceae bacterium]|jgi:argininosuccinate synthase|nr:argininosuccinate synthase domain-containing protein [Solirubrobacteraceae bacterium]